MITKKRKKLVTHPHVFFHKLITLSLLAGALPAWAADSPLTLIRSATERARAALQDPA